MKITDKEWGRMTDLVLTGNDGVGTAKILKNKDKAIARFVAGLKLENDTLNYNESWKEYRGAFSEFGNKAIELGATIEEIKDTFCENVIPVEFTEKLKKLAGKKLTNRFVGDLSKKILDGGFDINFLPHNGYAMTLEGKDAMDRNGRKWTIGYKTEISLGETKVNFAFDAITDEGDGPTSYVLDHSNSSNLFENFPHFERLGKNKFQSKVMESLEKIK